MKKTLAFIAALLVMVAGFSGCGKSNENIVPTTDAHNTDKNYEVVLDERDEKTQYKYIEEDLSLVDTVTGKKITLGMKTDKIEEITGAPERVDNEYKIYDGVVIKYKDAAAVSFIVSNGQFKDGKETRYFTSRGVGIGTSAEDFKKAYGDSYTEGKEETDESTGETSKSASKAVRYFKKDGRKVEFLGTNLSDEQKSGDMSGYYFQDFMFSNADGRIATIRITLMSESA